MSGYQQKLYSTKRNMVENYNWHYLNIYLYHKINKMF